MFMWQWKLTSLQSRVHYIFTNKGPEWVEEISGILGNAVAGEQNVNANVSNLLTSAEHKDEKRLIRGQLVV